MRRLACVLLAACADPGMGQGTAAGDAVYRGQMELALPLMIDAAASDYELTFTLNYASFLSAARAAAGGSDPASVVASRVEIVVAPDDESNSDLSELFTHLTLAVRVGEAHFALAELEKPRGVGPVSWSLRPDPRLVWPIHDGSPVALLLSCDLAETANYYPHNFARLRIVVRLDAFGPQ